MIVMDDIDGAVFPQARRFSRPSFLEKSVRDTLLAGGIARSAISN
jgi:hypothetical protein